MKGLPIRKQDPLVPFSSDSESFGEKTRPKRRKNLLLSSSIVFLALILATLTLTTTFGSGGTLSSLEDRFWINLASSFPSSSSSSSVCPQQEAYSDEQGHVDLDLDLLAQRLSQAVQIDTSVGDSWPSPTEDPERWSKFEAFHQHLVQTYPLTHQSLDLEKVNTHGLLYTWKGSESDLKPILLMSHQDVVPVNPETVEDWEHPPFSGFIDREKRVVWGRGSTDAKAWLVSILSSVEDLLAKGFQPNRTVLLSFGFDEEANGIHGASHLASRMEEIYGRDGLAMIVDEGNPVLSAEDPLGPGVAVALPGVEEKGSLDVEISIQSPGGHSSDPPQHTSIGLLAKVISQLEDSKDTLRPENLAEGGAQLRFLQCIREAPRFPPRLRSALKDLEWASRSSYGSNLLERLSERNREKRIRRAKERVIQSMPQRFKTQFLTTIAVDIVSGGIKINALPESAKAMINHRISTSSDIRWLEEKYVKDLSSLCQSLGLEFWAFGKRIVGEEEGEEGKVWVGKLIVEKVKQGFQPAPSTPLQGSEAKAWRLFSSVIRSTWPDKVGGKGNILVAPAIMQGNSDVRWHVNLTNNLFHFGPGTIEPDGTGKSAFLGVHTVNERYPYKGLQDSSNFYSTLLRAVSREEI